MRRTTDSRSLAFTHPTSSSLSCARARHPFAALGLAPLLAVVLAPGCDRDDTSVRDSAPATSAVHADQAASALRDASDAKAAAADAHGAATGSPATPTPNAPNADPAGSGAGAMAGMPAAPGGSAPAMGMMDDDKDEMAMGAAAMGGNANAPGMTGMPGMPDDAMGGSANAPAPASSMGMMDDDKDEMAMGGAAMPAMPDDGMGAAPAIPGGGGMSGGGGMAAMMGMCCSPAPDLPSATGSSATGAMAPGSAAADPMPGMPMAPAGKGKPPMGGMSMKGKGKTNANAEPAVALPEFAGAPHLYHVGAVGFFLDRAPALALATEQTTALEQRKQAALQVFAATQAKIDAAERTLWALSGSDRPDAGRIESALGTIAQLRTAQRLAFIRAVGDAATLLTEAQRACLGAWADGKTGMIAGASSPPDTCPGVGA